MYMIRIAIPGGGPITKKQWDILDDLSSEYTSSNSYTGRSYPSLRLTTRQNIQFHWVKKKNLVDAVSGIAKSGFYSINGCGDNVRNVMGCPLSHYSNLFDANEWAQKVGKYFQLPTSAYIEIFEIDPDYIRKEDIDNDTNISNKKFQYGPNLLNRKFKIAFSAVHLDDSGRIVPDNCVELLTNDIGVAPLIRNYAWNDDQDNSNSNQCSANSDLIDKFQIYIGGSQGERMGFSTFSALGSPFVKVAKEDLLRVLDAIVSIQQEWGDRQNRHWARMKYILQKMGIEWYRNRVNDICDDIELEQPDSNLDYGSRNLHHGWIRLTNEMEGKGKEKDEPLIYRIDPDRMRFCYGAFIENGRIIDDSPNGKLKEMVRYLVDNYNSEIFITPNQDLLFGNISESEKKDFENDMIKLFEYGFRKSHVNGVGDCNVSNKSKYTPLRLLSGSCVGRDTCRLAYTDSEKFEPYLIDILEPKWGQMSESIGVTGCERQCFRPATKTIGWVGTGFNMYMLKLGGTEDGRNQGWPLVNHDTNQIYLRNVPKKEVARITDALFEFYTTNMSSSSTYEDKQGGMGYFFRRIGPKTIIEWLKSNPKTADLMSPLPIFSHSKQQASQVKSLSSISTTTPSLTSLRR
ncbi:MAG TPA: hypothetical protein VE130_13610 [Nitrososphaeraceae archaeon]|nr:hypothetical protein [Nitrososphaeraceae archaeon]